MMLKDLAKQAIENSELLQDATNEVKKRTAVACINRELIESKQYSFDNLPNEEIDQAIEEVLHGS